MNMEKDLEFLSKAEYISLEDNYRPKKGSRLKKRNNIGFRNAGIIFFLNMNSAFFYANERALWSKRKIE